MRTLVFHFNKLAEAYFRRFEFHCRRTTAELKAVLNSFSRRRRTDPPDLHRILVVDEVDRLTRYWPPDEGGDSMDWRNMVPGDDGGDGGGGLDVLLALSPFPRGNDSAEVPPTCPITVPASTEDVLVWELTACYRNNPNIQVRFFSPFS